MLGGRYSRVGFKTSAEANQTSTGVSLGVTEAEESFRDFTFNANVTWRLGGGWQLKPRKAKFRNPSSRQSFRIKRA